MTMPCTTVCQDGEPAWTNLTNDYDGYGAAGGDGTSLSTGTSPPPYGYAYGGGYGSAYPATTTGGSAQTASPVSPPVIAPSTVPNAEVSSPPAYAQTAAPPSPLPQKAIAPSSTPTPTQQAATLVTGKSGQPVAVIVLAPAAAPPTIAGAPPWKSVLVLCGSVLGLHLLVRALRRKLTLRHLARPFWAETLDQRISNHWERMLIGLRDAGIHVATDEQPEALAKRVGIEGMETCATILERVRHGVRVDTEDSVPPPQALAGLDEQVAMLRENFERGEAERTHAIEEAHGAAGRNTQEHAGADVKDNPASELAASLKGGPDDPLRGVLDDRGAAGAGDTERMTRAS